MKLTKMCDYVYLGFFSWCLFGIPLTVEAQPVIKEGERPVKVISGYQFTEGPYWQPDGHLLFSDIPANTIYRWTPGSDTAEVYIKPSGHSNGIAVDKDGNLLLAQHDGMLSTVNADTSLTPVVKTFRGQRLNSPNDLTVKSDGSIYFTDPPFGVGDNDKELNVNGVYRIAPDGELMLLYGTLELPNGIVFSPDESRLYVNDSATGHILVFDMTMDGNVSIPDEFSDIGGNDGMTVDRKGNVYSVGEEGTLYIFDPMGTLLNKIRFSEQITNVCWGGDEMKTLYITAASGIYELPTTVGGVNK